MSKYRIHIENIGEGADWDGHDIECDGFAILADHGDGGEASLHNVSSIDMALLIGGNKNVRTAARIGLAIYDAKMKENSNPLASIISSIRPIPEDD